MSLTIPSSLSDHPSLVGIIRFPSCTVGGTTQVDIPIISKNANGDFYALSQRVNMATSITGASMTSSAITIPKSKVTDFYPYTYYVLTDGEADPVILHPQYMPSSVTIKGKFALSNQPVERYYLSDYKGDTTGRIYNITNLNQMMLPTASNEGLSYLNANANTIMQNRKSQITGNILSVGTSLASAFVDPVGGITSAISSATSGITQLKNLDARTQDQTLTPSTISSFGTPSTRNSFATGAVYLLKYQVKSNIIAKIENYVKRYGNKYHNYATINLKTYKGYLKMIEPDIDSKIDNENLLKIIAILERGVYIE